MSKLFQYLPVRRQDLDRNKKRHYALVLQLVQAYAIIASGVKISLLHTVSPGGQQTSVLSTQGGDVGANICKVLGVDLFKDMVKVDLNLVVSSSLAPSSQQASSASTESSSTPPMYGFTNLANASSQEPSPSPSSSYQANVQGYVSKLRASSVQLLCAWLGNSPGRSNSGSQFWYLNGRPVDLEAFSKAMNQLHRQFEMKHKPALVLDIRQVVLR